MKNNQKGQSTIEFIFSFIFAVSLILLVFNTSLNYTSGYVAHYATFMASRVFLTEDANDSDWSASRETAHTDTKDTFKSFRLDVFGIQTELEINDDPFPDTSNGAYLLIGVSAPFKRKMDIIGRVTGQTALDLVSESFLGREPTRSVCASRTCYAITGKDACDKDMDITLFDDGC